MKNQRKNKGTLAPKRPATAATYDAGSKLVFIRIGNSEGSLTVDDFKEFRRQLFLVSEAIELDLFPLNYKPTQKVKKK